MTIREITPSEAPLPLLLLADPSEESVRRYLADGRVFIAELEGGIVGAIVLEPRGQGDMEIMNLALWPDFRGRGIGAELLAQAAATAKAAGATRLLVGTGNSSLAPLAFYQRQGFRISGISRDYFKHYDPPIIEEGIPCLDMIHLHREL